MESHELHARVLGVCRQVLNIDDLEIDDEHSATDIPNYDSLAHIEILIACQRVFQITLSALEAGQIGNFGELKDVVRRKVRERA
jgi:acyl carrier protein